MPIVRLILTILLLIWTAVASPLALGAKEDEALDQFLARQGLTDLQILHLERTLQEQSPSAERAKLSQRLADLYASRLMELSNSPEQYQDLLVRVNRLLDSTPEADTPSLQVMLLQADYLRAEGHITDWVNNSTDRQALAQGHDILASIAPKLNEHRRKLQTSVERLIEEADRLEEGKELQTIEQQLSQRQAVAGRAAYFTGWSHYYLGLAQTATDGQALGAFQIASEAFRHLLDIKPDEFDTLEASYLGLDSSYRSRALIGLGMSEIAQGKLAVAKKCFDWLEDASVPPNIQDEAPYWHVRGLLNAGRFDEAKLLGQQHVKQFQDDATPGKVSLCVALVRAGFAGDDRRKELGMLGINGLTRLRQQATARGLIEEHNVDIEASEGFYLQWLRAQQLFSEAKQSKSKSQLLEAAELFASALNTPEARSDLQSAAACRYELGWCYYQAGQYVEAGREFSKAYQELKASGHEKTPDAGWMAFLAFRLAGKENPRYTASAIEALNNLKRDFPSHHYGRKADYQIAKLRQNAASPEESIGRLKEIKPDDANYAAARYDLCMLLRQKMPKPGEAGRQSTKKELRQAALTLWSIDGAQPSQKVKAGLMLADVALEEQPPDAALAESTLDRIANWAERLPATDSSAAEYHYRRLQLAKATKDETARRQHAEWLVKNAGGSAYDLPALIVAINAAEAGMKDASSSERSAKLPEVISLYERLAAKLGDTPQAIAKSKNARVVNSKLARYATELGNHAEAAGRLDRLLQADPKNKDYLRRAGMAHFEAGAIEQALDHWRTLLFGLPAGSDEWLEIKWRQLDGLRRTDKQEARKVWENFKLLYPDYGSPKWRERFQQLEQQL